MLCCSGDRCKHNNSQAKVSQRINNRIKNTNNKNVARTNDWERNKKKTSSVILSLALLYIHIFSPEISCKMWTTEAISRVLRHVHLLVVFFNGDDTFSFIFVRNSKNFQLGAAAAALLYPKQLSHTSIKNPVYLPLTLDGSLHMCTFCLFIHRIQNVRREWAIVWARARFHTPMKRDV